MMNKCNTKAAGQARSSIRLAAQLLPAIGLGLVLAIATASASAQRVLLDRIVALVDEGVVLQSELDLRMMEIQQNAARANRPPTRTRTI